MKRMRMIKKLALVLCLCIPLLASAQEAKKPVSGWQNLDLKTDSLFGIGTEKAYNELLKGKKHTTVLVAVIDGGVDTAHEDLKSVLWINPKEKAGDKIDNDKNGYADDVHGWNFIGSAKGNVHYDNLEITRLVRDYKKKFAALDTNKLTGADVAAFAQYKKLSEEVNADVAKARQSFTGVNNFKVALDGILTGVGKKDPTADELVKYQPKNTREASVQRTLLGALPEYKTVSAFVEAEVMPAWDHYNEQLEYNYNIDFDPRGIVGDNYTDSKERLYGNTDITGPDADHGSHVAGIIGANRTNGIGIQGVADDVRIMGVRTVPAGDERDKDVANAIRYAAANGARVINMSFGKSYSYDKKAVDEAVKFAMTKDVLIIHASGNDNNNTEKENNFPSRIYEDKSGQAAAWIEVGASGPKNDLTLKASFSNYGKTTVDVFAPGVDINSSTPGSKYALHSGTSMAAPVVAGLAALIRSYYPKLTALQVKDIILRSVEKVNHKVTLVEGKDKREVNFDELCATGGIVNAYNALKLAATYK
ncbi:S8 family peptidase [Mucilaginibacter calamicampi]|uniref:S8 family peptidase n=1 Tax=Mucilaginibacter calamicampi TaxID=1302352 RepID=A0ABW2Z0H6_9SPHI